MKENKIKIKIEKYNSKEIIVNNRLHINVIKTDEGYVIDCYPYRKGISLDNKKRNLADDLIGGTLIFDEDIDDLINFGE